MTTLAPPLISSAAELSDLGRSVRAFLVDHSSEGQVRDQIDAGSHDPAAWAGMCGELGLAGLAIPEEYGGSGYGFPELRIVLGEQGRALHPSPYLASAVLAAQTLLASGDTRACARFLPGIADGSTIATLAVAERGGAWDPVLASMQAIPDGDGWRLKGAKSFVLSGDVADLILVVGRTRSGPSLFTVRRDSPGLTVLPLQTLDGTRPVAAMTFDATPAELLGDAGSAAPVVRRVIDLGGLALAAEQVGAARFCLEMATRYAKDRHQFGRAIGGFQAIKHRLADVLTKIELSDALTEGACLIAANGDDEAAVAATAAHISASTTLNFAAAETIQIHGGIGFTWEHPAHLYFRRATASANLLGGPAVHHERLLDRLGV